MMTKWKKPTADDIQAVAKVLGDILPRHITQGLIGGPDICTHCGPIPRDRSFADHLDDIHNISFHDYRATVKDNIQVNTLFEWKL